MALRAIQNVIVLNDLQILFDRCRTFSKASFYIERNNEIKKKARKKKNHIHKNELYRPNIV